MSFQNITPISAVAVAAGAANNPVSVEMDASVTTPVTSVTGVVTQVAT
jgi:hypothetical protein